MYRKINFILWLALSCSLASFAQERPKIGLVLSGGGAKGMAHIGVLQEMEKAGLYPDYVTGTSMGSIVGGLYAIGYSADEIDSIARGMDWSQLLTNEIPLNQVAFEEKAFYGRYIGEFPFRNKKLSLPKGMIEGQALTLQMSNMTRPAHQIDDFNDFPIPFACIGANIETGRADVLNSGLLPEALRASMAIPTFFTPMEIDDNLYVDGGLIRNFPVQEVIDMGADIVIGVFVSSGLDSKDKLNSMVSVLSQAAFIMSAHDQEEQMQLADVLVVPNLEGYSTGSFGSTDAIIARGKEAGEMFYPVFKKLADSLSAIAPLHRVKKLHTPASYNFNNIIITGNELVPEELIMGKLRLEPGKSVTIEELEERIRLLYGTLYFEKIVYAINPLTSTLTIKVQEGPRGSLKLAVHYDNDNKAGLNANLTFRNLLLPSSRFIAEYDLAERPVGTLSYFKYMGKKQNVALLADLEWIQTNIPSYWDEVEDGTDKTVVRGILKSNYLQTGLNIQGTYAANSTFKLGAHYINNVIKPEVLDSIVFDFGDTSLVTAFDKLHNEGFQLSGNYVVNTLDKRYFASEGWYFNLGLKYIMNRSVSVDFSSNAAGDLSGLDNPGELWIGDVSLKGYIPIAKKLSIISGFRVVMTNGEGGVNDLAHVTFIGGFRPLALETQSFNGASDKRFRNLNYFYASLGVQWEIINNMYFNAGVEYIDSEYPMQWFYPEVQTNDFGAYPRRFSYSAALSYSSLVGPLSVGVGKDQYLDEYNVFFSIGYYLNKN